ncbi:MAG: hypothetical protein ABJH63_04195 [Rhizobiaceae bacterium]
MTKPRRSSMDIHTTLANLRAGRTGALAVCMSARINSREYVAAGVVVDAVDELVAQLTGNGKMLHAAAHRTVTGPKTRKPT